MREGRVFKRCGKCQREVKADQRICVCGYKGFSWALVVDVNRRGAPRRQRRRQGFKTKVEALAALNELQNDAHTGRLVKASKATIEDYLNAWLEAVESSIRPGTWTSYDSYVRVHIVPALGEVRLQELDRSEVKRFYAQLSAKLSPKTVHNVHICLRRALETAVEDNLIIRNPAAKAHKAPEAQERETWNESQFATFNAYVSGDRLYALWRLYGYTGARRGEVLALRWTDINLSAATVSINRSRVKGPKNKVFEGPPKTTRGRRTIDIDPETVRILRVHRKQQIQERLAFGEGYEDSGYVFCREDGRPYHPDAVSDRFDALCRQAGVPALGLHAAMRHLHGSILLRQGIPLHVVSRRLGHSNEAFTAKVYAHILPGQQAEAAAKFASALDGI